MCTSFPRWGELVFAVTQSHYGRDDEPAHHAPLKALISAARHPHRGRSAISTNWSAGQLGFVSWALSDEWIISSHLSLKTHCVQRLGCGGHQIQTGMWREEKIQTRCCHEYKKTLFGEKHVERKKMYLCWTSSKIFFLGDGSVSTGIIQEKWQFNFVALFPLCLSLCVVPPITHFA